MRRFAHAAGLFVTLAICSLHFSSAHAAALLLVGIFGSDIPSCGPVTPCRTLQYTVNKAAPGDYVFLGNPIGFGPATITKTINIVGTGQGAGVYSPAGVPCITINAGTSDVINIDGVTCDQAGAANDGILFNSGRALNLTDVELRRGGGAACGVRFRPNTNADFDFSNVVITGWGGGAACCRRAVGPM